MTTVPIEERSGMLEKALDFPMQIAKAQALAENLSISTETARYVNKIVFLGMGGSGVSGDFVRILLRNSEVPVYVCKGPVAPRFVDKKTLVIGASYSGKTWETLSALNSCLSGGARTAVVTSSHELVSVCNRKAVPAIQIPENGQARASFGYLLISVLKILSKAGIVDNVDNDIAESMKILEMIKNESAPSIPLRENKAYLMALEFLRSFPVIYGENNFTDAVALRWKQQLNENSKVHCYHDSIPELLHNEIEVWQAPLPLAADVDSGQDYSLALLRDSKFEKESRIKDKVDAARDMVQSKGNRVMEVWSRGESDLARLLSLSYLGDFVSIYLAIAKGVDPSDIPNIQAVKRTGITQQVGGVI